LRAASSVERPLRLFVCSRQQRWREPGQLQIIIADGRSASLQQLEYDMKVSDFVVERLHAWGVRRIYGYPGDGINGVIGALQRADKIEFIQVRHEEMATFMAVATPIHR